MRQSTAYLAALLKANADGRYRLSAARVFAIHMELRGRKVPKTSLIVFKEKNYVRRRAGSLSARNKRSL